MKSSVVHPTSMTSDNNSNKEVIQKTNTVVCKCNKKKHEHADAVVCNLRYNGWNCLGIFLPRQTTKNLNLPRHLRRQLPSAEANFEGCSDDDESELGELDTVESVRETEMSDNIFSVESSFNDFDNLFFSYTV